MGSINFSSFVPGSRLERSVTRWILPPRSLRKPYNDVCKFKAYGLGFKKTVVRSSC